MRQILLGILLSLSFAAAAEVRAVKTATAPTVDGRLDEAAWTAAPAFDAFTASRSGGPARHQTAVKCLYDERNLYFGFRCTAPDGARPPLAPELPADKSLYGVESVEVMLDPGPTGDFYYHFMVSSAGGRCDRVCEQGGILGNLNWNGQWSAKAAWEKDAYTVEIAIPLYNFAAVRARLPRGWRVNFCRNARPVGGTAEDSSAARGKYNVGGAFLPLESIQCDWRALQFGFGEADAASVAAPGGKIRTTPSVHFANATGRPLKGAVEAWICRMPDRVFTFNVKKRFTLADGASERLALNPVVHEKEGDYLLVVRAKDENGRTLAYADRRLSIRLAPLAIDLETPWYRNAIFASQNLREVRFSIRNRLAPEECRGAELLAEIVGEDGRILWSAAAPAAPQTPFALPAERLPEGRHAIRATLRKGGKPLPFGSASARLWKLPRRQGEVWMDRDGNWFRDGQPFYINTGWFLDRPYDATHTAAMQYGFGAPKENVRGKLIIDTNLAFSRALLLSPANLRLLQ